MRTKTQLFIALSIFACFAAAIPQCYLLNNNKEVCLSASSICTWTDVPANDTCVDACPLYPKVASDCTATKGCVFTAGTCTFSTRCATAAQAQCTAANNCVYTAAACSANPAITQVCSIAGVGFCVNPLPNYCTKTTATSCTVNAATTGTCAQNVAV